MEKGNRKWRDRVPSSKPLWATKCVRKLSRRRQGMSWNTILYLIHLLSQPRFILHFYYFFNVPWNQVKGMKLVAKVYWEEGSTNNMPCSFCTSFFVFTCSKVSTIDFDGFMFSWNCLLYQCTLFNFLLPWLYCLGMPAPPCLWAAVTFVTLKWLLKIAWRSRLCTCIPVCVSWRGSGSVIGIMCIWQKRETRRYIGCLPEGIQWEG